MHIYKKNIPFSHIDNLDQMSIKKKYFPKFNYDKII